MKDYSFLKKYILRSESDQAPGQKHTFYPLDQSQIIEAENRINRTFPRELKDFFEQIGYGFMCKDGKNLFTNRLMDPHSIADLVLGENIYEDYYLIDELEEEPHLFPFFEVGDDSFIFLDLNQQSEKGICPVDYAGIKIADSLEEFMRKLDAQENYYLAVDVD
ncbi:SMI1/KNR4 family protein [Laceyella putida]|uniref:SMI1/KNR4 family protein n=1 Tax=Laceyella putida TaxID=110101 RepID=A0ABW2RJ69_9BACL